MTKYPPEKIPPPNVEPIRFHNIENKYLDTGDMQFPICLTIREFCQLVSIGRTKANSLIREGKLVTLKIGSSTRITTASVMSFLNKAINDSHPPSTQP